MLLVPSAHQLYGMWRNKAASDLTAVMDFQLISFPKISPIWKQLSPIWKHGARVFVRILHQDKNK